MAARGERERQADASSGELKNTNYELFVAALSILAVINLGVILLATDPVVRRIMLIMNVPLTLIFLGDFAFRLATAESRRGYFFRQFGWADLAACVPLPQFKVLRLARVWRTGRLMNIYGARRLLAAFLRDRAGGALLIVLFLLMVVVEFGAAFVYLADRASPDANIVDASDAVWWAYITVATIGYGDRYPVTNAGRAVALAVAAAGVGLYGVLTGYLANAFLAPQRAAGDAHGGDEDVAVPVPAEPGAGPPELAQLLAEQRRAQAQVLERLAGIERQMVGIERRLAAAVPAEGGDRAGPDPPAGPATGGT